MKRHDTPSWTALEQTQDEPAPLACIFLLEREAQGRVEVISAGSEPSDQLNPEVVEAMQEVGIDISAEQPKKLEDGMVRESEVVITMGCGDACPIYPGKRYEDWDLEDPSGKDLETVRGIRDEISKRVDALVSELSVDA